MASAGRDNVWEYYFEPLVASRPAASVPDSVRAVMLAEPPVAVRRRLPDR